MGCELCDSIINQEPEEFQEGFIAYQNGDFAKAYKLLLRFAETESRIAHCLVGSMYHLGLGTSHNGSEAIKLYLKASQQGCAVSYNNLATIYSETLPDVPADPEKVKEYYRKAYENGFDMIPEDFLED